MKVWIVNHYAVPPSEPGGTRHYSLARELVRRGHEAYVIASSFDHATRRDHRLAPRQTWRREVVEGVTFVWLRTPPYPGNTPARLWNMLVFADRVRRGNWLPAQTGPDVVVGSSPHLFAALAAQRLANRFRVPFVLEVRDLWPQTLVDLGRLPSTHPAVRVFERIERYLYRRADRIITLLPGSVEHLVEKGADRRKVVWLPNGFDLQFTLGERPPSANGDVFTVMYAGAHGLANGLDVVLDAAAILQSEGWDDKVRFLLVGDGPEKTRLQRRAAAEGLGLVRFDPPVPKREILGYMQQADVFLMLLRDSPVFRHGVSPNKLFDYLAVGRPVIFGVNAPNNPVALAEAGLTVPPENARALADAVRILSETPASQRLAMGQRGRAYVEEFHNLRKLGEELESILMDSLGG